MKQTKEKEWGVRQRGRGRGGRHGRGGEIWTEIEEGIWRKKMGEGGGGEIRGI